MQEELLEAGEPLEPLLGEMEMYRARAQESFAYVFSSEHTTLARTTERPDPELSQAELGGADASGTPREGGVVTSVDNVVKPPTTYASSLSVPAPLNHGQHNSGVGEDQRDDTERDPVGKSKSCVLQCWQAKEMHTV